MIVSEIKDKNIWEDFLLECKEKTFLQSWNWGEFNKIMGNKIWRLGVYDNKELLLVVLAVKVIAKRGTFFMVQHGPTIAQSAKRKAQNNSLKLKTLKFLLSELKKIAKEESCSFIRIAPLLAKNEENKKLFQNLGFRKAPMHVNAYEATLKLNLIHSEEELLTKMRKTTRYLIRQALKNSDIKIIKSNQVKDIQIYDKLNQEVANRQRFIPFPFKYIKNEFQVFAKDGQALWFFGKYQSKIVAAALVVFWSGIGFYHQAALSPKYHKIPIAYLLQWEAIKEAKKQGCNQYDFWGYVDPKKEPKHPWAGPTLFKMGFGGQSYEYLKTQDLPLSWKYWPIYIFEKLRKLKRNL